MEVKLCGIYGYGETYQISRIELNRYKVDNTLAIQLYCTDPDDGFEEPFATLTVCLDLTHQNYDDPTDREDDLARNNISFLDTNNCSWGEDFVEKYKLGVPTGRYLRSGFCEYPLYEWNLEELKKYERR